MNRQDGPPVLYEPILRGYSHDSDAALAFERGVTGAPKPYPEEPGYLQISDPRGMS
jgi:hypothetical protein